MKRYPECFKPLLIQGFSFDDAVALRRISLALRRWFERECNGEIERDEITGKPHWYTSKNREKMGTVPDKETGAMKRLDAIIKRYPGLSYYIQGDPRGCAVYIIRPNDVPNGQRVESYYSRGIAVY